MRLALSSHAFILVWTLQALADYQSYCGPLSWGSPNQEDCTGLLNDFVDSTDRSLRIFAEEQFSRNERYDWLGLNNVGASYLPSAVQLPRLFTRGASISTLLERILLTAC